MTENMIFLGECGEVYRCRYCFDKENSCFMAERSYPDYHDDDYHEKPTVVSAQKVYDDFVTYMYTDGIEKMLEYCDEEQIEKTSDKGITEEEFRKRLSDIKEFPLRCMKKFGSTYIMYDKQGNILCSVFETKYFYAYASSRLLGGEKGFRTLNEAFSYAAEQVNKYYIYHYQKEEVVPKPEEKTRKKKWSLR